LILFGEAPCASNEYVDHYHLTVAVFKRAHTASSLVRSRTKDEFAPSEMDLGSNDDDMRMITASFVRAIERFTGNLCLHFSSIISTDCGDQKNLQSVNYEYEAA
jgi:hypothetical protein